MHRDEHPVHQNYITNAQDILFLNIKIQLNKMIRYTTEKQIIPLVIWIPFNKYLALVNVAESIIWCFFLHIFDKILKILLLFNTANLLKVDAAFYGNLSHFINHSCDPNLSIFNVYINCLDPNLPQLCLFARR